MNSIRLARLPAVLLILVLGFTTEAWLGTQAQAAGDAGAQSRSLQKRWLFEFRNVKDPKEVDRMIGHFSRAKVAGYNGVVFGHNLAPSKAAEFKEAASKSGLQLIPTVMGGPRDRNYVEGVLARDVLFVAHDGIAQLQQDNPTQVRNGDFEDHTGNRFNGWTLQDDAGLTTFADDETTHSGKASLRMESIGKNQYNHCRLSQPIQLQPHRQYKISFWVKTENLSPRDAEVKVLSTNASRSISFQTFHVESSQDWKHYDLVFNSLEYSAGLLYLGSWNGKQGKLWWDDVQVEEIALVNVLRRAGCPLTIRGDDGTEYDEGRDYLRVTDSMLNPWWPYHEAPTVKLASGTRIKEGTKLRVSYYHPIVVYEDQVTTCISEDKIFEDWRQEVKEVNELLHPDAFFMSHDELRVLNQCALCQSKRLTAGELLAWNVRKAAQIIRDIRPDAPIWVWSDMFDPMHNAVDHYYAVNGTLSGSWKGLDKDIGIVNWHGGLKGKNCKFFADLGLKQILSGYYDGDEDGSAMAEWLNNTTDSPGIVGAMYTSWEDKYDAMERWAKKAWGTTPALSK